MQIISDLEESFQRKYENFERKHFIVYLSIFSILEKLQKTIFEKAINFGIKNSVSQLTEGKKSEIYRADDNNCASIFEYDCILKLLNRMHFSFDVDKAGIPVCTYLLTDVNVHYGVSELNYRISAFKRHYYALAYLDDATLSIYNCSKDELRSEAKQQHEQVEVE